MITADVRALRTVHDDRGYCSFCAGLTRSRCPVVDMIDALDAAEARERALQGWEENARGWEAIVQEISGLVGWEANVGVGDSRPGVVEFVRQLAQRERALEEALKRIVSHEGLCISCLSDAEAALNAAGEEDEGA